MSSDDKLWAIFIVAAMMVGVAILLSLAVKSRADASVLRSAIEHGCGVEGDHINCALGDRK